MTENPRSFEISQDALNVALASVMDLLGNKRSSLFADPAALRSAKGLDCTYVLSGNK